MSACIIKTHSRRAVITSPEILVSDPTLLYRRVTRGKGLLFFFGDFSFQNHANQEFQEGFSEEKTTDKRSKFISLVNHGSLGLLYSLVICEPHYVKQP